MFSRWGIDFLSIPGLIKSLQIRALSSIWLQRESKDDEKGKEDRRTLWVGLLGWSQTLQQKYEVLRYLCPICK
jgi:hypothetical protein